MTRREIGAVTLWLATCVAVGYVGGWLFARLILGAI